MSETLTVLETPIKKSFFSNKINVKTVLAATAVTGLAFVLYKSKISPTELVDEIV